MLGREEHFQIPNDLFHDAKRKIKSDGYSGTGLLEARFIFHLP
jgi:hypothetical protein